MRLILIAAAAMLAGCGGGGEAFMEPEPTPIAQQPAPMPDPPPAAVRTAIVVGSSAANTLSPEGCCSDVVEPLRAAGFALESIDAPCHGTEACLGGGLEGWALEVTAGNRAWLDNFCARLRAQIGDREVYIAGISRGGYAALACDLGPPVKAIVAYAPVTDLYHLTEFDNVPPMPGYELMGQRIPTLIRIGKMDERVGTDAAVQYANTTGAELQLLDSPGHTAPEDGGGIEFLLRH